MVAVELRTLLQTEPCIQAWGTPESGSHTSPPRHSGSTVCGSLLLRLHLRSSALGAFSGHLGWTAAQSPSSVPCRVSFYPCGLFLTFLRPSPPPQALSAWLCLALECIRGAGENNRPECPLGLLCHCLGHTHSPSVCLLRGLG